GAAHVLLPAPTEKIQLICAYADVMLPVASDVLSGVLERPDVELVVQALLLEVAVLNRDPVLKTAVARDAELGHRSSFDPDFMIGPRRGWPPPKGRSDTFSPSCAIANNPPIGCSFSWIRGQPPEPGCDRDRVRGELE